MLDHLQQRAHQQDASTIKQAGQFGAPLYGIHAYGFSLTTLFYPIQGGIAPSNSKTVADLKCQRTWVVLQR